MDQTSKADRVDRAALSRRWRQEGRYDEIAEFRQQVKEATKKAWKSAGRQWDRDELNEVAWQEAARAFPPLGTEGMLASDSKTEPAATADPGVSGLGDLPEAWPTLAANASLPVEISWVSANRLRVRDGSGVNLSRALSPAPSYSALSWLETSILFPSKFADISVKATQNQEDEAQHVRRERLAIDEIRSLLAEMMDE